MEMFRTKMAWLNAEHFPILRLDHAQIELSYQALAGDGGYGERCLTFRAECRISHSITGILEYAVDDLTYFASDFCGFADSLKQVLEGACPDARLSPAGRELVLTVVRDGNSVEMHVEISEWQAQFPEITASASGGVSADVAHRWVREIRQFADRLRDFVIENGG